MKQVSTNPPHTSNTLSSQGAFFATLASFLGVSIHQILFLRRIYPPVSFLSARAYNYPVRQNRHPAVCAWVQSSVEAVLHQLQKGTVENVALCIFECNKNQVLERWTFDLRSLPVVEEKEMEMETMFETRQGGGSEGEDNTLATKLNVADLDAQFRAVLSRLNSAASRLKPLLENQECSFTITMEVRGDADRPVGRLEKEERKWVAAEPETWAEDRNNEGSNSDQQEDKKTSKEGRTVPVRRLEGELQMEVWVEESKAKFEIINNNDKV